MIEKMRDGPDAYSSGNGTTGQHDILQSQYLRVTLELGDWEERLGPYMDEGAGGDYDDEWDE
jgi:hypothetical protein